MLQNSKHVFLKSQWRDLASKHQILCPRQIFIILCGLFYQWFRRLECWRWSAKNYYVLYISSWNCQMLTAEQLLAGQAAWVAHQAIMVNSTSIGPLSSSSASQDANQGQHSRFVPRCLSPHREKIKNRTPGRQGGTARLASWSKMTQPVAIFELRQ
jgi:hypothetical protein